MEVKPGYKQTEVGVIPEEWEAKYLREVVDFVNGKPHESDRARGGRYFLITLDSIGIEGSLKAQHKETDVWDDSLKKDDLVAVLSDLAHGNLLGLCDLIPEDGKYVLNQRMGRLRLKVAADPLFIRLQINRRQSHFKKRGQGTSQRHIYKRDFDALEIPFAPEPEQRAIATALSDVDALLGALDRLIAKKRDLKQAAMQQLLTGQIRLPGFHGEWEVKRLGDHLTFLRNGVNSHAELLPEGRVKYLHYGDVHGCKEVYLSPESLPCLPDDKAASLDRLRDGDLIFADASEDVAGVSKSVEVSGVGTTEVVSGLHTIAARFDKMVLADGFKGFLQFCLPFATHLRRLAAGTKVYATNRAHVASVEMRLPSIPEQTAIAAVLSDMDAEIAALEQRRAKTRDLKQGMMQELLTGRIRLV